MSWTTFPAERQMSASSEADLLVDKAHLVMLKEQGLISGEVCSKIMAALDDLMQAGSQSLRRRRGCA